MVKRLHPAHHLERRQRKRRRKRRKKSGQNWRRWCQRMQGRSLRVQGRSLIQRSVWVWKEMWKNLKQWDRNAFKVLVSVQDMFFSCQIFNMASPCFSCRSWRAPKRRRRRRNRRKLMQSDDGQVNRQLAPPIPHCLNADRCEGQYSGSCAWKPNRWTLFCINIFFNVNTCFYFPNKNFMRVFFPVLQLRFVGVLLQHFKWKGNKSCFKMYVTVATPYQQVLFSQPRLSRVISVYVHYFFPSVRTQSRPQGLVPKSG